MAHEDSFVSEIIILMIWISLWGITDTIIEHYVPSERFGTRIVIYLVILCISFYLVRKERLFRHKKENQKGTCDFSR